jgi:2,3-bisphosphoglycerate-independent phosphoglycerate mutase
VTPGSGPAHLGLFGYDPLVYDIGRGVLEATGIGLEVNPGDVAIRGNFCTIDGNGLISDRRAGRISTEEGAKRVALLKDISIPGVKIDIEIAKEYRFAMVMRGEGLNGAIADTDPQVTGAAPLTAKATEPAAEKTARIVNQWLEEASKRLKGQEPANMCTLRGFAMEPGLPKYADVYKLRAACVAVYPMYKGVARLVGMDVIETTAHDTTEDEFKHIARIWNDYDFVFCHVKYTDSRGEDGDFEAKIKVIEGVDQAMPIILDMNPDVLIVTGDHSTPAALKSHSWHPVPTLLWAPGAHMTDRAERFGERECIGGGLGQFPAADLMPVALAHAKRMTKFGA